MFGKAHNLAELIFPSAVPRDILENKYSEKIHGKATVMDFDFDKIYSEFF